MNKAFLKRGLAGVLAAAMIFTNTPEMTFATELLDNSNVEIVEAVNSTEITTESTEIIENATETEVVDGILELEEENELEKLSSDSEEIVEDLFDISVDQFSVEMDGLQIIVKGKYSVQPKTEDISSWNCQFYLDYYSEDDTLLYHCGVYNLYNNYPSVDNTRWGSNYYPPEGTAYVKVSAEAVTDVDGITCVQEFSSETIGYVTLPNLDVQMDSMTVKATRFSANFFVNEDFTFNSTQYLYVSFIGGTSPDESTWQQIGSTQSYGLYTYDSEKNHRKEINFGGFEKGTTYYGKIHIGAGQYYDQQSNVKYTWQKEIPVSSMTTLESLDCFEDLTVSVAPFAIQYEGIVEVPDNSHYYYLYANEYDKKGEFLRKYSTGWSSDDLIQISPVRTYRPSSDCAFVKFSLENIWDESVSAVYSKAYEVDSDSVTFAVSNIQPNVGSLKFDVSCVGDLKLNDDNRDSEDFDLKFVGTKKGEEEVFESSMTSLYFYYYGDTVVECTLEGFEAETSYDGKIVIYKKASNGETYALYQEIPVTFTTAKIQEVNYFDNIEVDFGYFDSTYNVTLSRPYTQDYTYFYYWMLQFDQDDQLIARSQIDWKSGTEQEEWTITDCSTGLSEKTTYIQFAVSKDYDYEEVVKESKKIVRDQKEKLSFKISDFSVGTNSLGLTIEVATPSTVDISKIQSFSAKFVDADGNALSDSSSYFSFYNGTKSSAIINGLSESTVYDGYLELSYEFYNQMTNGYMKAFYQKLKVDKFTTLENKIYNLKESIPDPVFRLLVMNSIIEGNSVSVDETEVPAALLEKITYLSDYRSNYSDDAIKDLTGIELLTNLTSLTISNHEIDSVENIRWGELKQLDYLDLGWNNISVFPDLRKNTKLTAVYFYGNCLSVSEVKRAKTLLPDVEELYSYFYDQRPEGGFSAVTEACYYIVNGQAPIAAKLEGYKPNLGYTFAFKADGNAIQMEQRYSGDRLYYITDSGLSEGKHTLEISMMAGDEVITSVSKDFEIASQSVFGGLTGYFASDVSTVSAQIYLADSIEIENAYLVDKKGNTCAKLRNPDNIYCYQTSDPRYELLESYYWSSVQVCNLSFNLENNVSATGSYDILLVYDDETQEKVEDAVVILENDVCGINHIYGVSSYDNKGDYVYIQLNGYNIDPAKLNYKITYQGEELEVKYVSSKRYYSSSKIVKLEKVNWPDDTTESSASIEITPKSGYQMLPDKATGSVYRGDGIYYSAFNYLTNELEFAINDELEDGDEVTVKLQKNELGRYDESAATIATGVVKQDGKFFHAKFVDTEGKEFDFNVTDSFIARIQYGEYRYSDVYIYTIEQNDSNQGSGGETDYYGDYWRGPSYVVSEELAYEQDFAFYSSIEFEADKKNNYEITVCGVDSDYEKKLTFERSKIKPQGQDTYYTYFRVEQKSLKTLPVGEYELVISRNGNPKATYRFSVIKNSNFYLNSFSANWTDASTIQVYLNMPYVIKNGSESDYVVSLEDEYGNKVSGLTTKVTKRYSNGMYLEVKGLSYNKAKRSYYVKVEHKTLGAPKYFNNENSFFQDQRGELKEIYRNSIHFVSSGSHNVNTGVYLGKGNTPAKIRFYRPYDTEVLYTIDVTDSDAYFYFTKKDIEALPDPTGLYDVEVVCAEGSFAMAQKCNVAFDPSRVSDFSASIDKTSLFVYEGQKEGYSKTATISVSNYGNSTPKYTSSDTTVATVKVDESNPGSATVTAKGNGTATITVTCGTQKEVFTVTVRKLIFPTGVTFGTENIELNVGESASTDVILLPVGAINSGVSIHITSSDESVVSYNYEGTILTITAEKIGTTVLTATMEIDDDVSTAECHVTVKGAYTEEDYENLEQANKDLSYVTFTKDETLKNIALEEGWTWAYPETKLVADNNRPVQYFQATYKQEGYPEYRRLVPVALSQITGVRVYGQSVLNADEDAEFGAGIIVTGSPLSEETLSEYEDMFTFTWSLNNQGTSCELSYDGMFAYVVASSEEKITRDTTVTIKLSAVVDDKGSTRTLTGSTTFKVVKKPYITEIDVKLIEPGENDLPAEMDEGSVKVLWSQVSSTKKKVKLAMDGNFDWSIGNKDIASLSVGKYNKEENTQIGTLTIKKPGSTYVKITAKDAGKYSILVPVYVLDYRPILQSTAVTINPYEDKECGISFLEKNGMPMVDCEVTAVKKSKIAVDDLKVEVDSETSYITISYAKDPTTLTKKVAGKVNLVLKGENGEEFSFPITVTLNPAKPSVSKITQKTKPNLFYCGAKASFTFNSAYWVSDIYMTDEVDTGFTLESFVPVSYNKGVYTYSVSVVAKNLTKDTLSEFTKKNSTLVKVPLTIEFESFESPITTTLKVAYTNKAPSLKLSELVLTKEVNTETGDFVTVIDTTNKTNLYLDEEFGAEAKKNNYGIAAVIENGRLRVTGTKSAKSYSVSISNPNLWTGTATATGKLTVAQSQTLVFEKTSVVMNMNTNMSENGTLAIPVSLKGSGTRISELTPVVDSNYKKLTDNGYLFVEYDEESQCILLGINKGADASKIKNNSTYKLKFKGVDKLGVATSTATLSIKFTKNAPSVKLSAKGTIELTNRSGSEIVYTPTVSNITAKVVDARNVAGQYADFFDVYFEAGKIHVRAKEDALLGSVDYILGMQVVLDNGWTISQNIKFKPVNIQKANLPKAVTSSVTIYKEVQDRDNFITISSKAYVENVTLVEDKTSAMFTIDNFDYYDGKVVTEISLADTEAAKTIKPGKYTISLRLKLRGSSYNDKAPTVKVTVVVK